LTLIIDASVALKWFLGDEPHAATARALLETGEPLLAPDLIIAEVCNAAWLGVRADRLSQTQAELIARSLPSLFQILVQGATLAERAVVIAGQLGHPVYDCFYLALAEARGLIFVTADTRLLRKVRNTVWMPRIRSLAGYRPEA
jgi:predicted nucleic acid-binding protein